MKEHMRSVRYGDEPLQSSMSCLRATPFGLPLARSLHHTSVIALQDDDIYQLRCRSHGLFQAQEYRGIARVL